MSTVWSKLEDNAYCNPEPFPAKPRKPVLGANSTPAELRLHADKLESYDVEMTVYRERAAAYYARTAALEAEFRCDLELAYNMIGHPKADLLYFKSWEKGHSAGLHEVANVYSDLVELVQ